MATLFSNMCRLVERYEEMDYMVDFEPSIHPICIHYFKHTMRQIKEALEEGKVFDFSFEVYKDIFFESQKSAFQSRSEVNSMVHNFRFPFQWTIVNREVTEKESCLSFMRIVDLDSALEVYNTMEGGIAVGLKEKMMNASPFYDVKNDSNLIFYGLFYPVDVEHYEESFFFQIGYGRANGSEKGVCAFKTQTEAIVNFQKNRVLIKLMKMEESSQRSFLNDLVVMDHINTHKHYFIIEVSSSVKAKAKAKKYKKLLRLTQRPVYLVMKPKIIKKILGLPQSQSNGGSKAPHERRGHYRWLRNEKFSRDEFGEVRKTWVKNTWIGPSEADVGKRHYKVILDEP